MVKPSTHHQTVGSVQASFCWSEAEPAELGQGSPLQARVAPHVLLEASLQQIEQPGAC